MGLRFEIYRATYNSDLNVFRDKRSVTVMNISGPSEPSEESPAAIIIPGYRTGDVILVPARQNVRGEWIEEGFDGVRQFGGTFAATSDSRRREQVPFYGAVPIHDRVESYSLYQQMND